MFRPMRRSQQALSRKDCEKILSRGTSGVLAVSGDEDWPYAVPLSYVYDNDKIFFHCAKAGHKLDAIRKEPRVSFCVIDRDQIVEEAFTTYYRSVIAFGTVRILEDTAEKRAAIEKLALKYAPEQDKAARDREISREWDALCMLEQTVHHLTGKEAIELVRERDCPPDHTSAGDI